jgi:SagB-type dehydrogenase family enzyme
MHPNRDIFLFPYKDKWVLWDYLNHQQFEIDSSTWARLHTIFNDPESFDSESTIDQSLAENKLISETPSPQREWGWDILSQIFHIGTKDVPFGDSIATAEDWARLYQAHCKEVTSRNASASQKNKVSECRSVKLIPPDLSKLEVCLKDTLLGRETSRVFHDEAVSLQEVSTLLYLTLGFTTELRTAPTTSGLVTLGQRRTSPSSGGLNATEGYVYVNKVEGLESGVYYYDPYDHTLEYRKALPSTPLGNTLSGQHFINNLPLGIWLTSRLDKLWWKYEHSRTYRMALIEVGHISQSIQLIATGLKLQTWLTGAFHDASVEKELCIESPHEQALFFVGIGHGSHAAIPSVLEELITHQKAL